MRLTRKIQYILLGATGLLFVVTVAVIWTVETARSLHSAQNTAEQYVSDIGRSVESMADKSLLQTAHLVANSVGSVAQASNDLLERLKEIFNVSEIHVIGPDGIIHFSTVREDIDWDMASGEQSGEFMRLLHGEKEFVQPLQPKSNGGETVRYVGVAFPDGGFLQVALSEESFLRDLRLRVSNITELVHVGKSGYVILAARNGTILSIPPELGAERGRSLAEFVQKDLDFLTAETEDFFHAVVAGVSSYCFSTTVTGFPILVVQPAEEIFSSRKALMPVLFGVAIPSFLIFFFVANWLLTRFVTDGVTRIDEALGSIASGDLDKSVDVRSCDEFASLSDNINAAAASLRSHAEAERERLVRERDEAVRAEKTRSFFFATVSHDIRTPLNSILGFAQLLKEGVPDAATRAKYLDGIADGGKVLMQLINDVLDLSRLEAGKMVFSPQWCDVPALVDATVAAFEPRAEAIGITLRSRFPDGLPQVRVDPNRLRQILFNLLGNAIKFTPHGGIEVRVAWTPPGDSEAGGLLEIAVQDTGVGISPENLSQLGKPFVQLDVARGNQGTGLGLAITRQMLGRMDGELRIESALGVGSTFTIVLHRVESRTPPAETGGETPAAASPQLNPAWHDRHVLVVDDIRVNVIVLATMCRHLGLKNVVTTESGAEALELLRTGSFDLVLTDLWMPGMDGTGLASAMHSIPELKSIPICVVTADVEIRKSYREMGFDGILLKPILLEGLRDLLNSLLT